MMFHVVVEKNIFKTDGFSKAKLNSAVLKYNSHCILSTKNEALAAQSQVKGVSITQQL